MPALLRARGIYSLPNFLSEIPEGALIEALNTVIDRNGIIESRRGYKQWKEFGNISDRAKQLLSYRDKMLVHYDDRVAYETTGPFVNFKDASGISDASIVEPETGRRIRGAEASNGNFYLTANSGVMRLSSATSDFLSVDKENQLVAAGVPQSPDPEVYANYTSSGWMLPYSRVAYRTLVSYTDNNDNLLSGVPSSRIVVTNVSPQSCNTELKIFLPNNLTTDYFIQIYRSNNPSAASLELLDVTSQPDDEVTQIGEIILTQSDIDRGYIYFSDTVPAELQEVGTPLYSNQNTGEGALQINATPPYCKDIASYKGSMFFANTKTRHSLDINLLSVEGIEDLEITNASLTTGVLSLTTGVSHGLEEGESVFVVVPNTYRNEAYTVSGNTLINSSIPDGAVVATPTTVNGLLEDTFYFVRRIDASSFNLYTNKGLEVALSGSTASTLDWLYSVAGVYEVATVGSPTTLDINVDPNTLTVGTLYKNAKIFPAHFTTAKQDDVQKYYFGGSQGKFEIVVEDSVHTLGTAIEDKYFLLNSYDRLRPYTFYLSLNEAAPALDSSSFPETASTIPANVVISDLTMTFNISLSPTGVQDNYNYTTKTFTKANHGLVTGDLVTLNYTFNSTISTTKNYFVKRIDDNTFQLTREYNSPTPIATGYLPKWELFDNSTGINTSTEVITTTSGTHSWGVSTSVPCKLTTTGSFPTVTGDALNTDVTYYISGINEAAGTFYLYRTADLSGSPIDFTAAGTGSTTVNVASTFEMYRKDSSVQIAQKIAEVFDNYGDWNSSTTHTFTIPTSALTGPSAPPYYQFTIPSHGLSTGSRAIVLANGTGPELDNPSTDELPLDGYYISVVDSSTIELYVDAGFTARVDFATQGVGTLIIKTNCLTNVNITAGAFGYNELIPEANQTNPDLKSGDSTFTTSIIDFGYGEIYNTTTDEYLAKRSRFPLVADKIDETARSLIRLINANQDDAVTALYNSGLQDFTPRITFSSKLIDNVPIYFGFRDVQVTGYADGADDFEPTLPDAIVASSDSGLIVTFDTGSVPHGLSAGYPVVIYSRAVGYGVKVVREVLSSTEFTVEYAVAQAAYSFNLIYKGEVSTKAETHPNRIYYSKFQQPDAVPPLNYLDIGAKNKPIERILALRDSLIVLKEDGVFRISGDNPDFISTGFDSSNIILAPDSAVVLNNQVYAFTTQGVVTVTENGATPVSRFIENRLVPLTLFDNFRSTTFGVAYESDRAYLLFTKSENSDTVATQAWRYNLFTQAWTRWDKPSTCGLVNVKTNKHYWGTPDNNIVEEERKSFDRTDYADRQHNLELVAGNYDPSTSNIIFISASLVDVGDAIEQVQYVTLADIQNLALKLAIDKSMPALDAPFYANFQVASGQRLQSYLNTLITQLNTDLGTTFTIPSSDNFVTLQGQFNSLIDELNLSPALTSNNYKYSEGTKLFETSVLKVQLSSGTVTIDELPPFVQGPVTIFKGIKSDIIYAPISLGDPSVMKQVRETTTLFENLTFKNAQMGYATDLDAEYDFLTFAMQGPGSYGFNPYGATVFGGIGPSYPFRTYIPREKQRARYWSLRFRHVFARCKYAVLGVSVVASSQSERAYR